MEKLTKTERAGLVAAIIATILILGAACIFRLCSAGNATETSKSEIEQFIQQAEKFKADSFPATKKEKEKKTHPNPINPLRQPLERN